METLVIELTNRKALALLQDLEDLQLIKVIKRENFSASTDVPLPLSYPHLDYQKHSKIINFEVETTPELEDIRLFESDTDSVSIVNELRNTAWH